MEAAIHPYGGDSPLAVEIAAGVSIGFATITAVVYVCAVRALIRKSTEGEAFEREEWLLPVLLVLAAIWSVGPPIWFWLEYFWIWLPQGSEESFPALKYGQQLSAAIWAAIVLAQAAVISALK